MYNVAAVLIVQKKDKKNPALIAGFCFFLRRFKKSMWQLNVAMMLIQQLVH